MIEQQLARRKTAPGSRLCDHSESQEKQEGSQDPRVLLRADTSGVKTKAVTGRLVRAQLTERKPGLSERGSVKVANKLPDVERPLMSSNFFVIVHADRLHDGVHNLYPGTELFRKHELIASILEHRLLIKAQNIADRGGKIYFMGSPPSYLSSVSGITYIPDGFGEEDQFVTTAQLIERDGGKHVLLAGVYSDACISGFANDQLKGLEITAKVDPDLTDEFFDDYETKTVQELQDILREEIMPH